MPRRETPSLRGHWFWGNLKMFQSDSLAFLERAAACGDVVALRFGPLQGYFVNHPDYVRQILSTQSESYRKPSVVQRALSDITGKNIFTGNDDFWKQRRKLMQPAFHAQHIGQYAKIIHDYTLEEISTWADGEEIALDDAMTHLTMRIILKTMFDAEIGTQSILLGDVFTRLFKLVYDRMANYALIPSWIPTKQNQEIRRLTSIIRGIVTNLIEERRRQAQDRGDLLSILLSARYDDGTLMSDEELIREALTIFGAGFETTAYAITFAHYALSQHPDVMANLYAEVDEILGDRPIELSDLPHLPYTDLIVKETLRLYPTAWGFSRSTREAVEFDEYLIPANSTILISPWTLGRDARWFEAPLKFNPDRFDTENSSDFPRYAYLPFGGGGRICIGNQFAMMEARIIIATIAQHFSLHLKKGIQTKPCNVAFTLRPNHGMPMCVRARESVAIAY